MFAFRFMMFMMLIERLGKVMPKLIYAAFYLLVTGILLIVFVKGYDQLIYHKMLYKPEKIYKYIYDYIIYWWPQKANLGAGSAFKLIAAFVLPHFIFKAFRYCFKNVLYILRNKMLSLVGGVWYKLSKKQGTTSQVKAQNAKNVRKPGK
ncbi:hypothetical protein RLOatenuis_5680 [Rickettsiales bacterium]|nr:hypothetical protein RLOatenuis_5680 [Rickettsiales bacterium]